MEEIVKKFFIALCLSTLMPGLWASDGGTNTCGPAIQVSPVSTTPRVPTPTPEIDTPVWCAPHPLRVGAAMAAFYLCYKLWNSKSEEGAFNKMFGIGLCALVGISALGLTGTDIRSTDCFTALKFVWDIAR